LVEGSQGAMPQIRSALQAEEVKQEMRAEIAAAVREGMEEEIQTLAATLAATLVGEWQGFCSEHGDLCALAAENVPFRTFLAATPVDQLERLNRQAAVFRSDLDPAQLDASLADGTFAALMALPDAALEVLRQTRSPQTVLAWAELAGAELDRVVEAELYLAADPGQFSPTTVLWLVAIEDNDIIHNLLALEPVTLEALTRLPAADVQAVAATLPSDDLAWLAHHLAGQSQQAAQGILTQLASGSATVAGLQASPTPQPVTPQMGGLTVEPTPQTETASGPAADPVTAISPDGPNSVFVAAAMLLLLLIGLGVYRSLRNGSYRNL